MKNTVNHALKTTTPSKHETQVRIQQLKLGVDWHADHFRVNTLHASKRGMMSAK
jgi:hypothetical protein